MFLLESGEDLLADIHSDRAMLLESRRKAKNAELASRPQPPSIEWLQQIVAQGMMKPKKIASGDFVASIVTVS